MFARLIEKERIDRQVSALNGKTMATLLDAFKEGRAHVYYRFRNKDIIYCAVLDNQIGQAVIHLDGQIELGAGPLSFALLNYVYQQDSEADEAALQKRYGADYTTLSRLMELGPKQAESYFSAVKKVDSLAKTLSTMSHTATSRKPQLIFGAEEVRGWCQLYCKIGFDKLYVNKKLIQLFQAYRSGQLIQIQKEFVQLPPGSFDPQEEEAFQYAYNIGTSHAFWGMNSPLQLKEEELLEMLFMLEGHVFGLNKTARLIAQHKDIELSLDENGTLVPSFDPPRSGLRRLGRRAYRIGATGEIELYSFTSDKAGEIFDFYSSLKGLDASFLSQEVAMKILPELTEKDIVIAPGFEQKYPILRPRIEYYVGMGTSDSLSAHSVYRFGPDEISGDAFSYRSDICHARRQGFLDALKALDLPEDGSIEGGEEILAFLRADLGKVKDFATVYISEQLQSMRVREAPHIGIRTSSGQDWFSVELFSSGFTEAQLRAMVAAYHKKKKFIRLNDQFVLLDEGDESLSAIADSFQDEDFGAELPLYQALKLPFLGAETDGLVKDLIQSIQSYNEIDIELNSILEENARPYQRQGIRFLTNLYRNKLSGILSDDMGLGKTLQSFGLFLNIAEKLPILVVCPKSLIYNWMDERKKWAPEIPAYVLDGNPKERAALYEKMKELEKTIYFVSYDTLRNDVEQIKDTEFSLVLLDEAQYIANAKALKTKAVKELHAMSRIVLTGTPVQNSLNDLWSIFDFLLPGYFPPLNRYREQFGDLEFASEEARARLLAKIKPFLLGRKKSDVLKELPDKENIDIVLPMDEQQRVVYESHLALARQYLKEKGGMMKALSMMTRLRQICITPSLFLEGDYASSKISALVKSLCELKESGRRAIVFSSFVSALSLIKAELEKVGLTSESITGKTSAKVRVILADRFNEENSPIDVMLVSLKAGGTGLNLTGADTVFHLDPWWNIAAERQAEDRAHRIGQKNKVTVFKLLIKDSIEEKVLALQKMKGLLIDLTDEASLEGALTEEDYKFLLS